MQISTLWLTSKKKQSYSIFVEVLNLFKNLILYSGGKLQTNPVGRKKLLRKTIKAVTVVIKTAAFKKTCKNNLLISLK
jgi:hypothetical protein